MACPKGWEALTPLTAPDRATTPLLRNGRPAGAGDWETRCSRCSSRFKEIQEKHGPESVALHRHRADSDRGNGVSRVRSRKFGMGMIHGDGNTRQCMATAVVAYKETFGFDAPPYTYADFEESDVLVFVGANLCIAHPIMWQRVLRNQHKPQIIVIDPRKTETAMAATQHLRIAPKSDLALLYGSRNCSSRGGSIDRAFVAAHTTGFEEFAAFVEHVHAWSGSCAETGLTRGADRAASPDRSHEGKRVSFLVDDGRQSGPRRRRARRRRSSIWR